jgi:outer membrane protein assembly factor BamB
MPQDRRIESTRAFLALLCAFGLTATAAQGDDAWPGLWGPRGDGSAGPGARLPGATTLRVREAWRRPIGSAFSAIAVAGGRGHTALAEGSSDFAVAFDPASGRELWRARLGDSYRGHDGSKDGPASTPSVDEGRVFVVSRHGILFSFDAGTGRVSWQRDLKTEVGAALPFYGFTTSPLVSGRLVIVQAGGEKSGLVAFDKATGAIAWSTAHSKAVAYASPAPATLAGVAQLLVLANDQLYGVRPEDGGLLWNLPTGWTEEAMRAPLALPGDRVLISGTSESKLIELRKDGDRFAAKEAWKTPRLKNSLSPTVSRDGHLYGFNSGYLVCLDLATAEMVWREKVYAGSLILVDGHLLILGAESGELRVARASARGYEERLKANVFSAGATSVSGLAFAGGRLFLRNLEEIVALDIVE